MSLQTEDCGAIEITAEVRSLFKKSAPVEKAHDHSMHEHSMREHSMDKHSRDKHSGHNMHKMKKDGMDK